MTTSHPVSNIWDARSVDEQLREAISAVLYGAIWNGFDGPSGVTKDEALDYATKLAYFLLAEHFNEQVPEHAEPPSLSPEA